ncbi:ankyrin repeat domain-containing protein SOWAHA [Hemicordylus capensis]|uniref:ankyrin repeat domain-containing protein SOWAHA n=1 Tax=Hemicordylus capensis TaxID=884348 RepID=UPI00230465D8|nr:ankyrin repeat domain-containing protein SOWAHA [Hemicordylus capensis]
MAEPALSQAAVLDFLLEQGGKVRNSELLRRFEPLLEPPGGAEPEERAARRERFKHFVNRVAVVKELDGTKFVVLKKNYRRALAAQLGAAPAAGRSGDVPEEEEEEAAVEEEEEERGAAPLAPGSPAAASGVPLIIPSEQGAVEEQPTMPVSQLKSLFQREDLGEAPKVPSDRLPSKASPQKPCMLPVRCVPASTGARAAEELSPAAEQEQPTGKDWLRVEPPSARTFLPPSPYSKRRQLDEAESYLKRAPPKSQKVGEEACAETVPLEAAEHEWLVKATAGQWSQRLHGLLLRDKSLAGKRDFISGFTVLHWAAKSGNCDTVCKVIEVAEKGGVHVNVNTKSYGGYTPLHIAAIHGQEEVIAQLVKEYSAKVNLRDYSGKKPYQYLKEGSSFAVRHLLRDPDLHTATGHNTSIKKSAKVAASILSSTSTVLGLLSDDTAFYELTKGLKKPTSLNKFLGATAPRRKLKSRGTFSSHSSLSEAVEEEQEEATTKRRPVSELFFGF